MFLLTCDESLLKCFNINIEESLKRKSENKYLIYLRIIYRAIYIWISFIKINIIY